jgi:lactate permease
VRRLALPTLLLGGAMAGVHFVVAAFGTWQIASFAGGIAGLLTALGLSRWQNQTRTSWRTEELRALGLALSGYALLTLVTLGTELIHPVKVFLGQIVLQVNFPALQTSSGFLTPAGAGRRLSLFGHTGSVLLYSCLLAALVYARLGLLPKGACRRILSSTVSGVLPASVSIVSIIAMAVIMEHAGMTDTLARSLAHGVGALFPLASPWIGALGAFLTGSNTNSNMVFAGLQRNTAELLGYPVAIILAGQTSAAALASVIAPAKVVVGASTVGLNGQEGAVMRKMAGYIFFLVSLVCSLTLLGCILLSKVIWG